MWTKKHCKKVSFNFFKIFFFYISLCLLCHLLKEGKCERWKYLLQILSTFKLWKTYSFLVEKNFLGWGQFPEGLRWGSLWGTHWSLNGFLKSTLWIPGVARKHATTPGPMGSMLRKTLKKDLRKCLARSSKWKKIQFCPNYTGKIHMRLQL